jgi:hypothetical protein
MGESRRARIKWADTPIVTIKVVVPRCPFCWSKEFIHWRGQNNGDRSTTEWAICRACSEPFRIVRERSHSGNQIFWPDSMEVEQEEDDE